MFLQFPIHFLNRLISSNRVLRLYIPYSSQTAHMLEELSEEYADDIHSLSSKLNTLGKMVKKDNSNAMALHLFDRTLM